MTDQPTHKKLMVAAAKLEFAEFEVIAPEGDGDILAANIIDGLTAEAEMQIAEDGELAESARTWQAAHKSQRRRVAYHLAANWQEADELQQA